MKQAKISILISCVGFVLSCSPPAPEDPLKSVTVATPAASQTATATAPNGGELYAMNCMICHKDTGKGGPITMAGKKINPDDLTTDKMKKMSDDKMFGYISEGVEDEGMPAFKDKLKPEEIKSIIAHVRTLQR